jgi:integrase
VATIREKKPGVWEVRVFTGNDARGRPTQLSRTVRGTKRDAQRMAARLEVGPGSASPAGRNVSDVLDAWIDQNIETWAPASSRDQQSRVRSIKQDKIARMPIAQLSIADVERWHTRLRRQGMQDAGIRNQHGALSAAFGQAVRWGWVSQNVVALAQRKTTKKQPRGVMSLDDVRAVIDAAGSFDPAAGLAFRIAAMTGARRAELAALRWEDVDEDGMLTIDSAIEVIRHPGEPRELRDAPTKTGNARTITLDPDTLNAIWELRREREPYGPWMFGVGPDLVPPDHIGWWWTRARKESGIDKKWRLHDLRHWSATVSIGQGHDVRTVANRLGHSNPAMTLRVYAHAFAAADQALAAGLGEMLRGDDDD